MAAMRMMLGLSAAGIAYAGFGSGGAGAKTEFVTPVETALERLEAKDRVVNGTGLGSLTIMGHTRHANTVSVSVRRAGDEHRVQCHVTLTALSAGGSSAQTDCTPEITKTRPAAKLAVQALNIVVEEHVAATVENRAYDVDGVADQMLAFVAVAGPFIAAASSAGN